MSLRPEFSVLGLLLGAALGLGPGCATITPSDGEGGDGDGDGAGAPGREDDGEEPDGPPVVVASGSGGLSNLGGAPGSGGSGPTGPTPLPSCSMDDECNDNTACTDDTCSSAGRCVFSDNGLCECTEASAAVDCADGDPCTDKSCVEGMCVKTNNTASCDDDGSACTSNICDEGECTHEDLGLCNENTVTLRSVRDGNTGQWVSLSEAGLLVWNQTAALGESSLFQRIPSGEGFVLQATVGGLYVVLDANDDLAATGAAQEEAAVFEATPCDLGEMIAFGLLVTNDDDGATALAAEPGGSLRARSGGCGSGSLTAWERFEILSAEL